MTAGKEWSKLEPFPLPKEAMDKELPLGPEARMQSGSRIVAQPVACVTVCGC